MDNNHKLIVGLGNPGREYDNTRHNIGFDVVDEFARLNNIPLTRLSNRALIGDGLIGECRVHVVKPQTFMNLSGEAVAAFLRQKPIALGDIMVVTDDINLPVGKLRIRPGGSDGGHNGFKSLTAHLHSKEYPRLRFGVGGPANASHQIDFVLGRFSSADRKIVDESIARAVAALETWLRDGLETSMNRFNG